MLSGIVDGVSHLWQSKKSENRISFIDDGFSELIKWRDEGTSSDFTPIFPLDTNPLDMQLVQSYACQGVTFCLSSVTVNVLRKIKSTLLLSKASEVIVLMTTSPDAFKALISSLQLQLQFLSPPSKNNDDYNSYKWLQTFLEPAAVTVVHYPVHCFPILTPSTPSINEANVAVANIHHCEVYNLSSISCRNVMPLSLHNIGMWKINDQIQSIRDLPAGDVPPQHSSRLKSFAHELAGALIFDLELDPTSSINALGKSSSLIGHHMQPLLGALNKTRASLRMVDGVQVNA
jgi:hypothetical protein